MLSIISGIFLLGALPNPSHSGDKPSRTAPPTNLVSKADYTPAVLITTTAVGSFEYLHTLHPAASVCIGFACASVGAAAVIGPIAALEHFTTKPASPAPPPKHPVVRAFVRNVVALGLGICAFELGRLML